jgi:hypothetical protein
MAKNKLIFNPLSGNFDAVTDVSDIENRDKILPIHAFEDNVQIWGSSQPPMQDPLTNPYGQKYLRDGWYYANVFGQNIAWYFFDGATQATITKANFSCYAVMTLDVLTAKPILGVYSFPTGSGDILPGFAHSRWSYQISVANLATMTAGKKYLLYVGEDPSAHPELTHIPLTYSASASGGSQLDTEIISTSSLISDGTEPTGDVKWMVESLGVWSPSYKHELALRFKDVYLQDYVANQELVKEPTGFASRTTSTISFVEGSRQFTIAPTGTTFDVYVKGTKYSKTSTSITIPNTSGTHYIYFNSAGILSSTLTVTESLFADNALVSVVYWNSDNSKQAYFGEERHGLVMDGATHGYLHTVFGARYISGCALQGFTIGAGSVDADAKFTADSGSIRDEDILHQFSSQSTIPVLYRSGQNWRKKTADAFPFIQSGAAGYTGANGRIAFNEYTGGSWQLTEAPNNHFVLVHLFATNDINNPYVAIIGTSTYATKPDAQDSANSEIASLTGIPFAEFVAIGTAILQTSNSFTNSVKAAVQVTGDGANYVDFRGAQIFAPSGQASNHSLLSNLDKDDHIQYFNESRGDARYAITSSNLGSGSGVFAQKTGTTLELKSIGAGTNVSIASSSSEITISSTGAGEVNTASNVGTGDGVFKQKTGVDLEFKSLKAGTNITLTPSASEIEISSPLVETSVSYLPGSAFAGQPATIVPQIPWQSPTRETILSILVNSFCTSFSPDAESEYLAAGQTATPWLLLFKKTGDTFTQLGNPASIPTTSVTGVAWSVDSQFLAATSGASPFIFFYQRSGHTFTKLANPASLPAAGTVPNEVVWSPSSEFVVIAADTTPFIHIYSRSNTTFTKVANPSVLPTVALDCVDYCPVDDLVVLGSSLSPKLYTYTKAPASNAFLNVTGNFSVTPAGAVNSIKFNPKGDLLAIGHSSAPYISIYQRSGTTFTKLPDLANLPTATVVSVAWSYTGQNLIVSQGASEFIMYSVSGTTFTKLPAISPSFTGGLGFSFSRNGKYVSYAKGSSSIGVFKTSGSIPANSLLKLP